MRSAGQLPAGAEEAIRTIPGVVDVGPVLRTFATVEGGPAGDRRRLTLLAIGYRGPAGLGGPPFLVAGRAPAAPDEISLDRAAAHRLGTGPGATVDVAGDAARVVGITRGTNLLATQFAFVDLQAAEDALGAFGRPSFLVVRLARGAATESVRRAIEARVLRSAAFPRDEFVRNNVREISAGVLPVIALVTGLGLAVAVALVALLAQGLADDRRRDAAVLLALGASPRGVGLGVLAHVEKIVVLGATAGAAAAWIAAALVERLAPTVELTLRGADLLLAPAVLLGGCGRRRARGRPAPGPDRPRGGLPAMTALELAGVSKVRGRGPLAVSALRERVAPHRPGRARPPGGAERVREDDVALGGGRAPAPRFRGGPRRRGGPSSGRRRGATRRACSPNRLRLPALQPPPRARRPRERASSRLHWRESPPTSPGAGRRELLEAMGVGHLGGRRVGGLSAGEEQRFAVARALVHSPPVVLADEPTASLDSAAGRAVVEALVTLGRDRGAAILVATHDPRLAPFASRRLRIVDGRVGPAAGSPGEP